MKTLLISILIILTFQSSVNAQEPLRILPVDRNLNEYPAQYDLSTPLGSFITFKQLQANGKVGRYGEVNSYRIRGAFPKKGGPSVQVGVSTRSEILDKNITEVIYYGDSVAAVLSPFNVAPMYIIYFYSLEGGEWLGAGEGLGNDLSDARERFRRTAPEFLGFIERIDELKAVPGGADAFVDYLKSSGQTPKEFLLDAVAEHRIVVYGELHRRKSSWDLWKSVIRDRRFAQQVCTVFVELSSDRQQDMDSFFAGNEPDGEKIMDIFRSVQLTGWYDKGMYEFLIALWELNDGLPEEDRVRVVLVDEPRPFGSFQTSEDLQAHFNSIPDRNEQMARIVTETVQSQGPKRNNVFIVGAAHAFKSSVPGIAVGRPRDEATPSAVAQLVAVFSDEEVFSIYPHMPVVSNDGTIHGKVRHGVFDSAFAELGNGAIAFDLKDCPLSGEPFDGIYEIIYAKDVGSYGDNFDAYLFLEPLEAESEEYFLFDVLTDEFVEELKRRAQMTDSSLKDWFGVETETREAIIDHLKMKYEGKKRWETFQ